MRRDDLSRVLRSVSPRTPDQLHALVRVMLGFDVPRVPRSPGGTAPFDYLRHAFFEDSSGPRDCVVWACRGGGKTQLGAIATLLDVLFKPGVQVRILAGSREQASHLYVAFRSMIEREPFADLLERPPTEHVTRLRSGSRVEALAQCEASVRGHRVHKIRCDEVELIDDAVWRAAQLVTRSTRCGGVPVRGAVEAMSTMHRPSGLMSRLIEEAQVGTRRLFRWNVLDVLERCPSDRECAACPLRASCQGRAKRGRGFVRYDDALAHFARMGRDDWHTEMLCDRPSERDRVYPMFDPLVHVREFDARTIIGPWLGGVDFGLRSPTAFLWAVHDEVNDVLHVVDEHVQRGVLAPAHIERVRAAPWPMPRWVGADPAGSNRNDQTGRSAIGCWREAGFTIRARRSDVAPGVAAVAARLMRADGTSGLVIHPRCRTLIRSLLGYHYRHDQPDAESPVKDGPDHACDALRYLVVNLDQRFATAAGAY